MLKGRALPSVMDTSSIFDDTNRSSMGKVKKNNIFLPATENFNSEKNQKKQSKTESSQDIDDNRLDSFLKRKCSEDERSSDYETEYSNLKTVEQSMENAPSKLSKKLKKKRKKDICNSDSSGEENVNNEYLKSVDKNSYKNSKNKPNKKIKAFIIPDLLQKGKSVTKSVNVSAVKKEVLSDDAESSPAESDSNCHNSSEINQRNIGTIIKSEVHSNTSSDSEDEDGNISSAHEPEAKYSVVENPVTILQDIRLTPKSKSANEKLKEKYPGLKPIEIMTELKLSDSDEIHLFRIPKNIDPQLLRHAKINLEKACKVNLNEKYVITPTTKVPDPTLVISANTSVLCFKNNIKMEKYIKSKVEPNIEVPEKKSVPLPGNLKKRHPLFGSDFKQKIMLSEQVEQKLDEAIANLLKRERKSKKKKDKRNKQEAKEEKPNQEIYDLFSSHNFLTVNDRIKKETSDDSAFGSSSSTDKPRGKKKDKIHSSDMSIEQEMKCSIEKESREKRKEKTKKEKSSDHNWIDTAEIKKEIKDFDTVGTEEVSTSPKKKKKLSIINSTLMSDILKTPQFNSEVSTIIAEDSSGKKSKKSKKDRMSNEGGNIKKEELISELLNNVTKELNVSEKIKTEF